MYEIRFASSSFFAKKESFNGTIIKLAEVRAHIIIGFENGETKGSPEKCGLYSFPPLFIIWMENHPLETVHFFTFTCQLSVQIHRL